MPAALSNSRPTAMPMTDSLCNQWFELSYFFARAENSLTRLLREASSSSILYVLWWCDAFAEYSVVWYKVLVTLGGILNGLHEK